MTFDALAAQYSHGEFRARMASDKDSVNSLKNRLKASIDLHTEVTNDMTKIPWYVGLTAAEKQKLQTWKDKVQEIYDAIVAAGF